MAEGEWIETDVPARMDRLPWSRWHWLIVTALGVTWILDGLEVTLAGALGVTLKQHDALGLTDGQVGASASFYLTGAVLGALVFGYGTDRLGRKKLFYVTLLLYLVATAATAFSWNFASYSVFRFLTGAGIGGEYAAINSAIDELIPARRRGQVDLIINSTYWIGAALGAAATVVLLNPKYLPVWLGWRFAFGIGAVLGLVVLFFRHWVPESPRWLMIHDRKDEAERIVAEVEKTVTDRHPETLPPPPPAPAAPGAPTRAAARPRPHPLAGNLARDHPRTPPEQPPGAVVDGGTGVLLQRDLFHLRPGTGEILWRSRARGEPVPVRLCAG